MSSQPWSPIPFLNEHTTIQLYLNHLFLNVSWIPIWKKKKAFKMNCVHLNTSVFDYTYCAHIVLQNTFSAIDTEHG